MSKEAKITVLVVEPQKKPYVKEIDNTLASLQREVGGYIQAIYPFPNMDVAIVANDEAKLNGEPLNRALRDKSGKIYDIVAGTFIVVGLTEDDFGSLNDELTKIIAECFKTPELFIYINGKLAVIPVSNLENRPL